jgi:L-ascorbate metabolism protein UlaG (beta-lactamase superfamily)
MRVSLFIHSCVLVEEAGSSILFDPGKFSFIEKLVRPEDFQGLTAVILTHGHPDHLDTDTLTVILAGNPGATVYANQETVAALAEKKIDATVFESGSRDVGAFRVRAAAAEHAPILGSKPPQNTAYLVDEVLLNPGDSFAETLDEFVGTKALLLPVMAPWEKEPEMMAFAERMKPRQVVPLHDGQAKDFFLHQRYATFQEEFTRRGIAFAELYKPGDSVEV